MDQTQITADIVFADPPYALSQLRELPLLIIKNRMVKPGGLLILEHGKEHSFEDIPEFDEVRTYGNVNFSIFQF